LLAAAARAVPHADYPALALDALGLQTFTAAVALVRRCGATPRVEDFDPTNGYTNATAQERAWATLQRTLTIARGAAAEASRHIQRIVETACVAGPSALSWSPAPLRNSRSARS
jgi:hypothetical protein